MSIVDVTTDLEGIITGGNTNVTPPPAGLSFGFGALAAAHNTDAPRIVWVPIRSPLEAAEHGGQTNPSQPLQIGTRSQFVEAHCWGFSDSDADDHTGGLRQAEQLADIVWQACQILTPGAFEFISDDPGQPDNLQRGWLLIRTFRVKLPVTFATPPSTTVTTVAITSTEMH